MHDWIIDIIQINWTAGTLSAEVHFGSDRRIIYAKGVSRFSISLEDFWGPSNSILQANGPFPIGKRVFYELEIQSGDRLLIEADNVLILPATSANESLATSESDIVFRITWESKGMTCFGPLSISCQRLARFFGTKQQPSRASQNIKTLTDWIVIGKTRNVLMIDMESGDRMQIEEIV